MWFLKIIFYIWFCWHHVVFNSVTVLLASPLLTLQHDDFIFIVIINLWLDPHSFSFHGAEVRMCVCTGHKLNNSTGATVYPYYSTVFEYFTVVYSQCWYVLITYLWCDCAEQVKQSDNQMMIRSHLHHDVLVKAKILCILYYDIL